MNPSCVFIVKFAIIVFNIFSSILFSVLSSILFSVLLGYIATNLLATQAYGQQLEASNTQTNIHIQNASDEGASDNILPISPISSERSNINKTDKIASKLMCLVCEGQTIASSDSKLAKEMKMKISDMLQQGKTEQQILKFFASKYGDKILLEPKFNPLTALLWFLPFAAFITGVIVIFKKSQ